MAWTINDPTTHFQVVEYTGNYTGGGSTQDVTLPGDTDMQPDLVWIKSTKAEKHCIYDAIRGATKTISSDSTAAESTDAGFMSAFNSDGFSVGAANETNENATSIMAFCWKAGGSTSSNTTGDITSTVSVNSTAKFSIVSYTGNGSTNQTVGHSLGVTPEWIWIKNRDRSVYHPNINPRFVSTSNPNMLYINVTEAESDDTNIQGSNAHSSTIFGVDDYTGVNVNTEKQIAYCFASVQGFSKFGTYEGTGGTTTGPFIYLGFRPAWIMVKCATNGHASAYWRIWNDVQDKGNPHDDVLDASEATAEDTTAEDCDFLANGFKFRASGLKNNDAGERYVFFAFARAPLVNSEGVPGTTAGVG